VELIWSRDLTPARIERRFGHSTWPSLILWAFFVAPAVLILFNLREVLGALGSLPWIAWIVAGPVLALFVGLGYLLIVTTQSMVLASWRESNWVVKLAPDGLYLQLRSYLNHPFPDDGPTVVFVPFAEIASARKVVESFARGSDEDRYQAKKIWVELELCGASTGELEARLLLERNRPAPSSRILGVRVASRFQHTPVVVPRAGVVQIEWLGRSLWRALEGRVKQVEPRQVDLDAPNPRGLEGRIAALVARGEELAAVDLAREERRMSLTQARSLIGEVRLRGSKASADHSSDSRP
jgi:hypothetical protein